MTHVYMFLILLIQTIVLILFLLHITLRVIKLYHAKITKFSRQTVHTFITVIIVIILAVTLHFCANYLQSFSDKTFFNSISFTATIIGTFLGLLTVNPISNYRSHLQQPEPL